MVSLTMKVSLYVLRSHRNTMLTVLQSQYTAIIAILFYIIALQFTALERRGAAWTAIMLMMIFAVMSIVSSFTGSFI